jgi:[glutamine synthetase] adenylyltransferase / [glutamine synthetase]-adenylyl-L-tyrosine phosphorylase
MAAAVEALLAAAPDPESSRAFLNRIRSESPLAFERVAKSPMALRCAVSLPSYSRFLLESVRQDPAVLLHVAESGTFYRLLSVEDYRERLEAFLGKRSPNAVEFARFRRRQLLRILLRDVVGVATVANVTEELSNLADAILDSAYRQIRARLVKKHGEPRLANGERCGFSVISVGKLGGKELNYSSDIDLIFVYGGNGSTDGATPVSNKQFCSDLAQELTRQLSTYTPEGLCYRVDLRLRPDGTGGEICISAEGARAYYTGRARDWEKQMLIKARISAGDPEPGAELLEAVEPLIYRSSLDFRAVEAVSETRQRITEKLAARGAAQGGLDVKLTPGGIRDIEFLVQCLQRLYGGREQWVRHGGTLFALFRLRDKEFLSDAEYARLVAAYEFLRNVEHRLQMEEDRQTHVLPPSGERLDLLARKMPAGANGEAPLKVQVECHLAAVREIYDRVVHGQRHVEMAQVVEPPRPPRSESGPRHGRERYEAFLQAVDGAVPDDAGPAVADLFEHSVYFGDQLLRYPELVSEIRQPFEMECAEATDAAALRRCYRRQMLRIQSDSLRGAEIFETLGKTSLLADSVIAAAYRIALHEAPPPSSAAYTPGDQMMVITLGRLGMREFDLGSDADVNFTIPDADSGEQVYWTGVAERIVQILSSYTGEGVMFVADTRLRPSGREGDLVQTEGAYKAYFAEQAEAWEGIAYMKARAVAGNLERATEFLHELQDVDWRRYGQSMRSRRELERMRARLEREQGPRNPLKAGAGGYYDIDFALMYLRLREAGVFYRVLNTPERIRVIEQAGGLSQQDAEFLREAATFYRALDHGQRITAGRAEGSLPASQSQREILTALVKRWTPERLHERPLEETLHEIRTRTREYFDRVFGGT